MSDVIPAGCMETWSGEVVSLLDPRPEQIHVDDVAFALANAARFGGHVRRCVADHCLLTAALHDAFYEVSPAARLHALLHEAHEAYYLDVHKPLKSLPQMAWYKEACARMQAVIYAALRLPEPTEDEARRTHHLDTLAMLLEAEAHLQSRGRRWACTNQALIDEADEVRRRVAWMLRLSWYPEAAQARFLRRYAELRKEAGL